MSFYFSYDAGSIHKVIEKNLEKEVVSKMYTEEELHCTMLFSDDSYKSEYNEVSYPEVKTTIQSLEIWQAHNGYVLVARLEDSQLKEYNQNMQDTMNIKDTHPTFKPHITIQKETNKEDLCKVEKLTFLIGQEVLLNNFNCLIPKNKIKVKM